MIKLFSVYAEEYKIGYFFILCANFSLYLLFFFYSHENVLVLLFYASFPIFIFVSSSSELIAHAYRKGVQILFSVNEAYNKSVFRRWLSTFEIIARKRTLSAKRS